MPLDLRRKARSGTVCASDSELQEGASCSPRHFAIIMDGNRRWARQLGLSLLQGHTRGVEVAHRIVSHAIKRGLEFLTLYAFSSENWKRPEEEVRDLLGLARVFFEQDLSRLDKMGVRIRILGCREGLDSALVSDLEYAEALTSKNDKITLLIALNYGSQDEIVRAAKRLVVDVLSGDLCLDEIAIDSFSARLDTEGVPPPDVLVRTSGEKRISNFLLWQCAYTEFVFLDTLWPDFDETLFDEVIEEFKKRERRFGGRKPEEE